MHKALGAVTCPAPVQPVLESTLEWQNQRQQSCGVARIFQRPVLLTAELHAGQLQRAVEPQRPLQASSLGEALFEVHVRHSTQAAVDLQALPFLEQLFAIVIAPTGPTFKT